MVKLKLTLVAMTFIGFAQAQSFKFSVGYGLPWISQQIGTNSSTSYTTTLDPNTGAEIPRTTNVSKIVKGSYGAGWNASGAFGYKLSEHIGLELGISYLAGKEYSTQSSFTDRSLDVLRSSSQETETSKSRAILFTPAIKFLTQKREFTPYFLIGPVLGKINYHRSLERSTEEAGSVNSEFRNTRFRGGISLGLRGAVGATIVLNKKISLFSEITFIGMNYYPEEGEITRYTINGEDKLSTLTGNVRKTIYADKIENDSRETTIENSPGKSLRFPVAMSSVSGNVGVVVNLQ
jgi:hypothetical protein